MRKFLCIMLLCLVACGAFAQMPYPVGFWGGDSLPPFPKSNDLVVYYTYDFPYTNSSGIVPDQSPYGGNDGNTLTGSGTPIDLTNYVRFVPDDDIEIPDDATLSQMEKFTLYTWINPASTTATEFVYGDDSGSAPGRVMQWVRIDKGKHRIALHSQGGGADIIHDTDDGINQDVWTMVAWTVDASNTQAVDIVWYTNGISAPYTALISTNFGGFADTGIDKWIATRAADDFHGDYTMSEFGIWTNVLTPSEMLDLHTITKDRPPRD